MDKMVRVSKKEGAKMEAMRGSAREIILLDMDCFEVQVWCKDQPDLENAATIVANSYGKIIAVNYSARSFGISRSDSLSEAKEKCPDLIVVPIPERGGKQDQRPVIHASYIIKDNIVDYFQQNYSDGCENMKMDFKAREEFYLDVTHIVSDQINSGMKLEYKDFYPKTILEGKSPISGPGLRNYINGIIIDPNENESESKVDDQNIRLLFATVIAGDLIRHLLLTTGYQASAGVATNKLKAKLACTLNKPKAVTTIIDYSMENISKRITTESIIGLGGTKGKRLKEMFTVEDEDGKEQSVTTMFHLRSVPREKLIAAFGKTFGTKIAEQALGMGFEPVENRGTNNSTCTERSYFWYDSIKNSDNWEEVLQNFSKEMSQILQEEKSRNGRRTVKIKIHLMKNSEDGEKSKRKIDSGSFSCPVQFTVQDIYTHTLAILENWKSTGSI